MPYTSKQERLFRAAAHDKQIAEDNDLSQAEARKLADEAARTKTKTAKSFIDLTPIFAPTTKP